MSTDVDRVRALSTAEQNPAHQIDALVRAGVAPDDVHVDHASGAKASRLQLDLVLKLLRGGDTLVVTRLDRLGRSVLHLVTLCAGLRERGVGLRVLEQGIDSSTTEGRAMFGMLSVLAELQRELIVANRIPGNSRYAARGGDPDRCPGWARGSGDSGRSDGGVASSEGTCPPRLVGGGCARVRRSLAGQSAQ